MIPATTRRVQDNTAEEINRRICWKAQQRVAAFQYATQEEIDRRLDELDSEWDIERTLEANAATVCVASVILGLSGNRRWLVVPGIVGAFLLQHAIQGWCPPLPLFRRLGVRTAGEIEDERRALRAIRDTRHASFDASGTH